MTIPRLACIFYAQNEQGVHVLPYQYQGEQDWICPAHLLILFHKPGQMAGKLSGIQLLLLSEADE